MTKQLFSCYSDVKRTISLFYSLSCWEVSNYSALDHDQGSCYTNVKITFVLINSVKKTENSKIQTIPFEKVLDILDSKNALQTLKHYECKHWQGAFEDKFWSKARVEFF